MSIEKNDIPTEKALPEVGLRLKAFRESLNLKISAFSRLVGINRSTLYEVENQKYDLSSDKLALVVRNTNVSARWLLTGEGEMTMDATSQEKEGRRVDSGFPDPLILHTVLEAIEEFIELEKIPMGKLSDLYRIICVLYAYYSELDNPDRSRIRGYLDGLIASCKEEGRESCLMMEPQRKGEKEREN